MITQPVVSSMIAEATMIWPRLRRMKFISRTTIATILMEEIESAVPRNSDATRLAALHRQQRIGKEITEREAASERHGNAGRRDRDRGHADLPHQLQIGLHAGQQQQHQHAHVGEAGDQALLSPALLGKISVMRLRPDPAEQGRPENKPGEQIADDARAGRSAA